MENRSAVFKGQGEEVEWRTGVNTKREHTEFFRGDKTILYRGPSGGGYPQLYVKQHCTEYTHTHTHTEICRFNYDEG